MVNLKNGRRTVESLEFDNALEIDRITKDLVTAAVDAGFSKEEAIELVLGGE